MYEKNFNDSFIKQILKLNDEEFNNIKKSIK